MRLRYDLDSMKPGILVSPHLLDSALDDHADLTLTGGLNSFTLRGSIAAIRALLTDATAILDQVQADGNTHYKIKENNMSNPANHQSDTNEPFSLNLNPDTLPDVSLEHDSTTDEAHIKFFNVDNEIVLDLWGQLNDVGSLLSSLSIIAKYHALRTGLYKAVAEEDLVRAVEIIKVLKSLQRTPGFNRVFENVDVTTSDSPKKDPERATAEQGSQRDVIGFDALTDEDVETFLAMLDEGFNGK